MENATKYWNSRKLNQIFLGILIGIIVLSTICWVIYEFKYDWGLQRIEKNIPMLARVPALTLIIPVVSLISFHLAPLYIKLTNAACILILAINIIAFFYLKLHRPTHYETRWCVLWLGIAIYIIVSFGTMMFYGRTM
jgi:uncharacterized protein YqhQ